MWKLEGQFCIFAYVKLSIVSKAFKQKIIIIIKQKPFKFLLRLHLFQSNFFL